MGDGIPSTVRAINKIAEYEQHVNEYNNLCSSLGQEDTETFISETEKIIKIQKETLDFLNRLTQQEKNKQLKSQVSVFRYSVKNAYDEMVDKLKEFKVESVGKTKLFCPYCKTNFYREVGDKEYSATSECTNCGRVSKIIFGIFIKMTSRGTGQISYAQPNYNVRFKLKNTNKEEVINFNSNNNIELKNGDKIAFIYKKKFFGNDFNNKPSFLLNYKLNTIFNLY